MRIAGGFRILYYFCRERFGVKELGYTVLLSGYFIPRIAVGPGIVVDGLGSVDFQVLFACSAFLAGAGVEVGNGRDDCLTGRGEREGRFWMRFVIDVCGSVMAWILLVVGELLRFGYGLKVLLHVGGVVWGRHSCSILLMHSSVFGFLA